MKKIDKDMLKRAGVLENDIKINKIEKKQYIVKDIFRRFFSSKRNIFFTSIVIFIILMSIIIPIVSQYNSSNPVSSRNIHDLILRTPGSSDIMTATLSHSDMVKGIVPWKDNTDIISQVSNNGLVTVKYHSHQVISTILGTDTAGRDIWTRLWKGTGNSLLLAVIVSSIEFIIGVLFGIYLGFNLGKKIDTISMRIVEIFGSVPQILGLIVLSMLWGTSFGVLIIILVLFGWIGPLYTARMYTIKIKDQEFVIAAFASGASTFTVLFKHILPKILGRLLVTFIARIPSVIFLETFLIFLGFVIGDGSTMGSIINDSKALSVIHANIWYVLSVSFVLVGISISLQMVANGLGDAMNMKSERVR